MPRIKINQHVFLNFYREQLIQHCVEFQNGSGSTVDFLTLWFENNFQTNLIQYLSVQSFTIFSDHKTILLRVLGKNMQPILRKQKTPHYRIDLEDLYRITNQRYFSLLCIFFV